MAARVLQRLLRLWPPPSAGFPQQHLRRPISLPELLFLLMLSFIIAVSSCVLEKAAGAQKIKLHASSQKT